MKTDESVFVTPIISALVVAILPHVPGLPLWINLWCLAMWGYMLVRLRTGWPVPGTIIRHGLAVGGLAGLMLTFSIRLGSDAFVGLMAIMAAIKPFEMATHRHRMITILLTYFIIITSLFRSDSLWILVYMLLSVFITTTALIRINHPMGRLRSSFGLSARILAQAIPLAVILFLLFPRLQDSLFGIRDTGAGRTGFSNVLQPGSVSRMSLDDSPAFRAIFQDRLPPADALYWRAIVFNRFNGREWRPGHFPTRAGLPETDPGGLPVKEFDHTIVLEPHKSRWLVALDRPVRGPDDVRITSASTLQARGKVRKKKTYQVVSVIREGGGVSSQGVPARIGSGHNPRARELARKLTAGSRNAREKIDRILAYFSENRFTYTLNPHRSSGQPVDDFLFRSRTGYCEHFASATAFMLNAADVPARIVGGFLGGELNPYGNYLNIKNAFAHAWVEAFIPARGWIRIDPTLAVEPDRLARNPDGSRSYDGEVGFSLPLLKKLEYMLEAVNQGWINWFTGYSHAGQRALLAKLGLEKALDQPVVMGIFLGLTLLVLAICILFFGKAIMPKQAADPTASAYRRFLKKLSRVGLQRHPARGPRDFAREVSEKRPDLAPDVTAITDLYIRLRFCKDAPDAADLVNRVKRFRPGRKPKTI